MSAMRDKKELRKLVIELNQELAEIWPNISEQKEPLEDADKWNGVPEKIKFLER